MPAVAAFGRSAFPEEELAIFARPADFNGLDAASCDPLDADFLACPILSFLLVLFARGPPAFEEGLSGLAREEPPVVFPAGDFEDFLRVFLDIRLPFVAFRGSIVEVLRQAGIKSTAGRIPINRQYAQRKLDTLPAC
jgi:hypothetical protein